MKKKDDLKTKNKRSKQKTNILKTTENVFDDFEDKKRVIQIKDEITDVDFDDFEGKKPVTNIDDEINRCYV